MFESIYLPVNRLYGRAQNKTNRHRIYELICLFVYPPRCQGIKLRIGGGLDEDWRRIGGGGVHRCSIDVRLIFDRFSLDF